MPALAQQAHLAGTAAELRTFCQEEDEGAS
jgi:hypothetical protein